MIIIFGNYNNINVNYSAFKDININNNTNLIVINLLMTEHTKRYYANNNNLININDLNMIRMNLMNINYLMKPNKQNMKL